MSKPAQANLPANTTDMATIRIQREDLLKVLKENLANHEKEFAEILAGYKEDMQKAVESAKKSVIEALDKDLKKILAADGKDTVPTLCVPRELYEACRTAPVSRASDYKRAIRKIELSVDSVVSLDDESFRQFVEDEWDWKQQFRVMNSTYNKSFGSVSSAA